MRDCESNQPNIRVGPGLPHMDEVTGGKGPSHFFAESPLPLVPSFGGGPAPTPTSKMSEVSGRVGVQSYVVRFIVLSKVSETLGDGKFTQHQVSLVSSFGRRKWTRPAMKTEVHSHLSGQRLVKWSRLIDHVAGRAFVFWSQLQLLGWICTPTISGRKQKFCLATWSSVPTACEAGGAAR